MPNYTFPKLNDETLDKFSDAEIHLKTLYLFGAYYAEYYKEKFIDLTFLITEGDQLQGYVQCCVLDQQLCYPNDGITINLLIDSENKKTKLYSTIIDHLNMLAKQYNCRKIIIKDYLSTENLSNLGELLFKHKYHAKLTFDMSINYTSFNETNYHRNLRKSYKSLINWGKNNLAIKYINKNNDSFAVFQSFKDFHLKVAGRKTRSDESWQIQYDMVKQGWGELILAYYNNQLSCGSLFIDHAKTTIYFTGVYDRNLFAFGISHYTLYHGICRSYLRGNTSRFSLGYFDTDIQDNKWYNIQFFKKGFGEILIPTILWSMETNK